MPIPGDSPVLFRILFAVAVVACLTGLAMMLGTTPRAIGRHLAHYPGTLLVGALHGAFVAVAMWSGALLLQRTVTVIYLALNGALWAGLHVLLETHAHRRRGRRAGLHRAPSGPGPAGRR
jgi:hypothetical protein